MSPDLERELAELQPRVRVGYRPVTGCNWPTHRHRARNRRRNKTTRAKQARKDTNRNEAA